ncbi:hypothetical protein VNO80_10327 [Phaseolus coccineus]|uniref:Uncharacterized protein n=1 Tax=Phaseolus coccineus TaxID=3886 RepID=A0AAN9ND74_PHACN
MVEDVQGALMSCGFLEGEVLGVDTHTFHAKSSPLLGCHVDVHVLHAKVLQLKQVLFAFYEWQPHWWSWG